MRLMVTGISAVVVVVVVVVVACSPSTPQNQAAANSSAPPTMTVNEIISTTVSNTNTTSAQRPLAEPKGPIDPRSVEAAGQVVQHYGALIERKRWVEARRLWSNAGAAAAFERRLRGDWTTHLEIGKPRDVEGAAGSIYVTVPAVFYNDMESGQPSRLEADIILRRVNDVPGSTEAQRRWHIERIDWKEPA